MPVRPSTATTSPRTWSTLPTPHTTCWPTPVLNDLCRFGGPFAAGDLHARCAHDAALGYAGRVRQGLDTVARTVPGGPRAGTAGGLLTADQVRAVWDEVVRLAAPQVQRLVGWLPPGAAIDAALAGELWRTAAGRAAPGGPPRRRSGCPRRGRSPRCSRPT